MKIALQENMIRQKALEIVTKYIQTENLIHHMLAVEAAMRFYARQFNMDEELWAATGLLHDFDWEIHPTSADHAIKGVPILQAAGFPEEVIHAILSHNDASGVERTSLLDKTLCACDEITGLISAVALVRPSRSLYDLEASSVKKKWKDKAFAAGANRDEIALAAEALGIPLWDHVLNVIKAMRTIAPEIGLAGSLEAPSAENT